MASKKKTETALVLRTCNADLTSHGGFQWPSEIGAVVEAPDWKASNDCGNGLRGWLYGEGDHSASDSIDKADAKWLVVEVMTADLIALGGKVKFPKCTIRHIGDQASATAYLMTNEPRCANLAVIGACRQVGPKQATIVGYKGTASAGDEGTASAGDEGTASAGDWGTASAGDRGTASAGNWGTASAGDRSTASAGDEGTASAGNWGTIHIKYWDAKAERYRMVTGYIGEDGLEPNVPYKLDDNHKFVRA